MKNNRIIYMGVLLMTSLLLVVACKPQTVNKRDVVTVSIEPLRYIVNQIVGDKYQVVTLAPSGVSPETYEPTPKQLISLSQSEFYFCVGTLGFENNLFSKISENIPNLKVVRLNANISSLPNACSHHHEVDNHHTADPHIWTSPENVRIMARTVCQEFCKVNAPEAKTFKARLKKFEQRIDSLETQMRQRLAPVRCRVFFIQHPALAYFARDFGFIQRAIEDDGKEASPLLMSNLIKIAKNENVQVVLLQKEFSGISAKQLASQTGARLVEINPLDYDWMKEMNCISVALTLKRK